MRRLALALAAMVATAVAMPSLATSNYPEKTIRIVVPLAPGGSNDVLARVLANEMSQTFGVPVIVENKPGAAGNIGTDHIAKSAPDGYTLGIAPNQTVAVNPVLYKNLPFNAETDITGISLLARLPMILVAHSGSKLNSIEDVIEQAKSKPGHMTYASAGAGSPQHMAAEVFQSLTGTEMTNVPYKGSAPALVDVTSGTVDIMFGPVNSSLPMVQSGKLKALGVTSSKRLDYLPDVPTIAEKVPGFEGDIFIWIGLIAPGGTPPEILEKLNAEVNRILQLPYVQKTLAEQGIQPEASTVEEFNRMMQEDRKLWAKVIQEAGITID